MVSKKLHIHVQYTCVYNVCNCVITPSAPSTQATLMEFPRGSNGLLGFGINEAGVVQKVDGMARTVGLQRDSRLLQVSWLKQ